MLACRYALARIPPVRRTNEMMKLTHSEASARGGKARAAKLTKRQRRAAAKLAAGIRWERVRDAKSLQAKL